MHSNYSGLLFASSAVHLLPVAGVGFEPTSLAYEASVCTTLLPRNAVDLDP